MPCCGDREKGVVSQEEKWDYINLKDFKSESCLTPFSYFFLWVFLLISLAVYAVDIFTAVNLLAFSRWAGQIKPAIPFQISRWIFAVCIIISFVLLILRWVNAIRAIRSGSIAQSYLNSLAVRIQSVRMGKTGRGWKRFLVFAELTKSKKGAEYVALFAYFSFETWMNTIFADGPRQVVNALTLYSVMQLDLLPGGQNAAHSDSPAVVQFFNNVKILAEQNNLRALILFGMLFTLVIWVLSIIKLALAIILYLIFLFHHIPADDGSLKTYCRRKINTRLMRIVRQKVDKALAKGIALQDRAPTRPHLGLDTKPTLPAVGGNEDDKGPIVTTISRSTTQTTLPPYSSRPGTAGPDRNPKLPDVAMFEENPPLSRTLTKSSAYSDAASISGSTGVSGYSPLDRQTSPAPPVPPLPNQVPVPLQRNQVPMSRSDFMPAPLSSARNSGPMTPAARFGQPGDDYEAYSSHDQPSSAYHSYGPATGPTARSRAAGVAVSSSDRGPTCMFSPSGPRVGSTPRPSHPHSAYAFPPRSYTPASSSVNQSQPSLRPVDGTLMRSFPYVGQRETPGPQEPNGYSAFNQSSRNSPEPASDVQNLSLPVYTQEQLRPSPPNQLRTGPPSSVRAYTPREYAPQPQPPREDFF
ncbi:hypothetical protein EYZ11_008202 [Aspergillus tanneri]|uniref:Pheromone-regulated membrane protein 6 n=1 Tax=Aspergillus tanneri TaxID=1220188 RepID=A0A4S3JB20_9EURO|nr:uncharacterized protein ATNIH1004_008495 [Aspergillus tanneri]KAA8644294.1 hypothetical protein ATNIH1004_008495 [Aspergillus tanneri]THC92333.1 hypothetical protein EYZ11_008202 [Aspergillus tanneri]